MPTLAGRLLRDAADVVDDPKAALRAGVARLLKMVRAWRAEPEPQHVLPLRTRRAGRGPVAAVKTVHAAPPEPADTEVEHSG